ncbi:hypothetical protein niasHT_011449 [Heterodera trifolii]|uniref:Uncharacterized protein n=1 Tax=Heterodera trifolii TaxID=157864 RepID=A0ABD2L165_9BILA
MIGEVEWSGRAEVIGAWGAGKGNWYCLKGIKRREGAERYGRVKWTRTIEGGRDAKDKRELSAAAELRAFRWTNSAVGKGEGGEEIGGTNDVTLAVS